MALLGWRVLTRGRRTPGAPGLDAPIDVRTERRLVAVLLVVAAAVRLVGWDTLVTPVFWFSQVPTLFVARMLEKGRVWTTWLQQLHATQVGWSYESVVLLPLLAGLQEWLGPRFGLPVLSGALVGTLSVLFAWALGRRTGSQAFGLLLAAFVACSPLQITWARIGPYYIAAVPQVLLAMLVGQRAGARASLFLAALAGVVAWTSVYEYYAARVAIPLTLVAMLAGMSRWTGPIRRILLVAVCCGGFVAAAAGAGLHTATVRESLWPSYGGYAGNKGERTIAEFVERNLPQFLEQGRLAPERYFWDARTSKASPRYGTGLQSGGLCLVPTALLGALGLLVVLRRVRTQWPWLVVAVAGLALPVISVTTARRLLVFDVAWSAFAAYGVLALVETLGAAWSRRARAVAAAGTVGLVAAWSFVAVFALDAALPGGYGQPIPFGESGFGDGVACKRCVEAAKEWQRDIADGAFVVLFDNDGVRENRTSPGGLRGYGKIAAMAAGKPDAFVDAYAVMADWDGEFPSPGVIFDAKERDFATYLVERIEGTAPGRIVWQFERPTPWESWLARRLADAGGRKETFETPLSPTRGLRVTTAWDRRAGAFGVMRELAAGWRRQDDSRCVTLADRASFSMAAPVLVVAGPPDGGTTAPPTWVASSWAEVRVGPRRFEYPTIAASVPASPSGPIELLGEFGRRRAFDRTTGAEIPLDNQPSATAGFNCAAHVDGAWWAVNPLKGTVTSQHAHAASVPADAWIGAAEGSENTLVLASANQSIAVVDVRAGRVLRRFPARVSPSVRLGTDECTQIAVGVGWLATIDVRTGIAAFYDGDGRALGTKQLDALKTPGEMVMAFAGAGSYLAVGTSNGLVRTFEVVIDPSCEPGSSSETAAAP